MLRAGGNGSADQHTVSSYQIGSYELWRVTPQGLFNVHFKNKVRQRAAAAAASADPVLPYPPNLMEPAGSRPQECSTWLPSMAALASCGTAA